MRYFQPRPSVTGYSGDVTFFNNLGPNYKALMQLFKLYLRRYLALERPYTPGLDGGLGVPVDVRDELSLRGRSADLTGQRRIQANRIARVRQYLSWPECWS